MTEKRGVTKKKKGRAPAGIPQKDFEEAWGRYDVPMIEIEGYDCWGRYDPSYKTDARRIARDWAEWGHRIARETGGH